MSEFVFVPAATVGGFAIISMVLQDGFEVILLPRAVHAEALGNPRVASRQRQ